ncbi:hypothetical protein [Mesorhizobium sp.]|uniref:hypothetical protein n=1 Tax=Mesorhizobium sp. TaxID=1871066 RepID=UPI0025DF0D25|nr:hypothetical protein [Mesorhizobium sp.]
MLAVAMAIQEYAGNAPINYESAIITTRKIADLGFSYCTSILGFLITGFAIFASITKPEIFVLLAKLDHDKAKISRLHFIFFSFLFVFIHYIAFLLTCLFIILALGPSGPFADTLRRLASWQPRLIQYGGGALVAIGSAWFVFLVMLLKSFIWNIYQAILLTIATASLPQNEIEALIKATENKPK